MTAVTPESIVKIAMGFMAAKHLFVASEVGLFEALAAGPATIEELARRTNVPPRTIAIAAAAMVSLGLIEQDGERYQNGEPATAFLAGKPGPDLRPMLRFFDQISYPTWQKLADAVRTGNGQAQFGKFDKRQQEIFSAGVEAISGPGETVGSPGLLRHCGERPRDCRAAYKCNEFAPSHCVPQVFRRQHCIR
jgi:Dimerisation domain